ncbi:CTP synthase [Acinetobacter oleivorans]|nr:CTP synthase [Acinetobacter oleivorans]CAI3119758.1 CTP synthase [Acinetobacter oleivorans]CAI3119848.1 CTP synthase [Acinetobacter oleivorans]CAI3119908.1 CTP synthase [Acinetobacter oleivorans]CAI3119913.1 CTP synthase [Acinetobacter oleivorans]
MLLEKPRMAKICLLGDFSDEVVAHRAINLSFIIAETKYKDKLTHSWVRTKDIDEDISSQFSEYDAIWCVPASPYENMSGVLNVLNYARTNKIPFLGTCGGYQHVLVEYARNVLSLTDADHAEVHPDAVIQIVSPLSCALVETNEVLSIHNGTFLHEIYGVNQVEEQYHCSFGFNEDYLECFKSDSFKFSVFNNEGNVRAFELSDHPFFVGTSYQPERASFRGELHPIVDRFISAAIANTKVL